MMHRVHTDSATDIPKRHSYHTQRPNQRNRKILWPSRASVAFTGFCLLRQPVLAAPVNFAPHSIVLYAQTTGREVQKPYIVSGITLLLVQTVLIAALVWQRARRRKAEAELSITYDRLRMAV